MAIPVLARYATDLSGTLTPGQLGELESLLSGFDKSTSTQIVVLMVPTMGHASLEDLSLRIVEANKIGQKRKDNGVLLFIAKQERKIRIETGYGLEGALPDALAGIIIRREITPRFREGDYAGGIKAGVLAIIAATRNEYKASPVKERKNPGSLLSAVLVLVVVIFVLSRLSLAGRSRFSGGRGPWMFGGWGGGGGGGSFGGGGGFSGGGGSFGGGGASGGW